MKSAHHALLIAFLISASLLPTGVLAADIFAGLSTSEVTLNLSSVYSANLTITNAQNTPDNFFLYLKGIYPDHIFIDKNIIVAANSTATLPVSFYPTDDIGRFDLVLYGESIRTPLENFTIPIKLWVQHPDRYAVKGFRVDQSGSQVTAYFTIKPHDRLQADFVFDVIDLNEKVVKSETLSKDTSAEETVTQTIGTSDLAPGRYTVRASIKGTSVNRTATFDVGLSKDIKKEKTISSGLLFDEVKITLNNYGNLVENDYKVYEDIGKNRLVTLLTTPTDIIKSGDNTRYEFTIEKIRPGEVVTIIYRLENWQNLLTTSVIAIIVIVVAVFLVLWVKKPKITKRVIRKGHGEYSVVLEMRNSRIHNLKDVVVRDWVQPLARVKKHDTFGLTPNIKESQMGTEIAWKLGPLKRGEYRVIHYTIESVVNAESLKLSSASFSYLTERGKRKDVRSNEAVAQ